MLEMVVTKNVSNVNTMLSGFGEHPDTPEDESDPRRMETVLGRIQWLMKMRNKSMRKLCMDAGLSPQAVAVYKKRLLEKGSTELASKTIDKIAASEGCNREWLRTGNGDPGLAVVVPARGLTDPYPSRLPVAAMAKAKGYDRSAIDAMLSEQRSDGRDPGSKYWMMRLMEYVKMSAEMDAAEVQVSTRRKAKK